MELKNVNPNGNNVAASKLNNINYYFLKIELKNKHYILFKFKKMSWLSEKRGPHIIHFTNQHWMNQSSQYRYESIPHQKKKIKTKIKKWFFLVAAWAIKKNLLSFSSKIFLNPFILNPFLGFRSLNKVKISSYSPLR
jgi:hypothetical protein